MHGVSLERHHGQGNVIFLRGTPALRLLVNADDLGLSPKVNASIFALMSADRIRSATLMPNGRAFDEAVSEIANHPHCSFGVHLNIAGGLPVGEPSGLAPILDSDGRFRPAAVRRLVIPTSVRAAVLREWRSQIAKVRGAGVEISHIDSHHHTHNIPALFGPLKHVQREFGIKRVRTARSKRRESSFPGGVIWLGRMVWHHALRLDGTKTTDSFCSLAEFKRLLAAKRIQTGTLEIVVHPGPKAYEEETALLASDWWTDLMRDHDLISYNDL